MRTAAFLFVVAACQSSGSDGHGSAAPVAPVPRATADCTRVAEFFASYDLGNYAEPEDRAPVIAKYQAECERAGVTKEQQACVEEERDKWGAAQCVPLMAPDLAGRDPECRSLAKKLEAVDRGALDEYQKFAIDRSIRALWRSCEQDGWPKELKTCIGTSPQVVNDPSTIYACQSAMGDLYPKIQERLVKSLQRSW